MKKLKVINLPDWQMRILEDTDKNIFVARSRLSGKNYYYRMMVLEALFMKYHFKILSILDQSAKFDTYYRARYGLSFPDQMKNSIIKTCGI